MILMMNNSQNHKARGKRNQKLNSPTLELETTLKETGIKLVAGVDEAGRGAWAGPIVAAAVILPEAMPDNLGINDSKQLTPAQRDELFVKIQELAVAVGVGVVEVDEIDRLGVAQATYVGMARAVEGLQPKPEFILVDGFKVNFKGAPSSGIIGGDAKVISIAAASIMAKVARDRLMVELHNKYPRFGFAIHKGYGTALHQERIVKHGVCPAHRKSFAPVKIMLHRKLVQATL